MSALFATSVFTAIGLVVSLVMVDPVGSREEITGLWP